MNQAFRKHLTEHHYDVVSEEDKGSHSHCFIVSTPRYSDTTFICKIISYENITAAQSYFKRESQILLSICNPNIVKIYDFFEGFDVFFLILENCEKGNIEQQIRIKGKLQTYEVMKYCKNILEGLNFLHKNNIAHHEIKPSNFLIDKYDRAKLGDLANAARYKSGELSQKYVTNLLYSAPEVLEKLMYDPFKADIWSFGVSLYQMVTGDFPFHENDIESLKRAIFIGNIKIPNDIDPIILDIIKKCLNPIPSLRPSVSELLEQCFPSKSCLPKINKKLRGPASSIHAHSFSALHNISAFHRLPMLSSILKYNTSSK